MQSDKYKVKGKVSVERETNEVEVSLLSKLCVATQGLQIQLQNFISACSYSFQFGDILNGLFPPMGADPLIPL